MPAGVPASTVPQTIRRTAWGTVGPGTEPG